MKTKLKEKRITLPIYGTRIVYIRTNGNFEALKDILSKKHELTIAETAGGFAYGKVVKGFYTIFIAVDVKYYKKKPYKKADLLGTILHEVIHAVNYLFIHRGMQLDRYNDEHQADVTEWIFMKAYKFFK